LGLVGVMLGGGWREGIVGGLGEAEGVGGRSTLVHGVAIGDDLGPDGGEARFDELGGGARWRRDVERDREMRSEVGEGKRNREGRTFMMESLL
jgi:hypothetical protein